MNFEIKKYLCLCIAVHVLVFSLGLNGMPVWGHSPGAAANKQSPISAGTAHIVGVNRDGSVTAVGENVFGNCNVSSWRNITAVSCGDTHTVGLMSNGEVVAVGDNQNAQCEVGNWRGIVAVAAGSGQTIGLTRNGNVLLAGYAADSMRTDLLKWQDVVSVAAGTDHAVGLKKDGTVVATGQMDWDDKSYVEDVEQWSEIKSIAAGSFSTYGVKRDGTVVVAGNQYKAISEVTMWKNITVVTAGMSHVAGLRTDGTVVAAGDNQLGQCNVSEWRDVVFVTTGGDNTIGVMRNGTVLIAGNIDYGMDGVKTWKNLRVNTNDGNTSDSQEDQAKIEQMRSIIKKLSIAPKENAASIVKRAIQESVANSAADMGTANELIVISELGIQRASQTLIASDNNRFRIDGKLIAKSVPLIEKATEEIVKAFKDNGIKTGRSIQTTLRVDTSGVVANKPVILELNKDIIPAAGKADQVAVNLGSTQLTFRVKDLAEEFADKDRLFIEVQTADGANGKTYTLLFRDAKGKPITSLKKNLRFAQMLDSGDPSFSAVYFTDGKTSDSLGGQFSPATKLLEIETKRSGSYYVTEKKKTFDDIADKPENMQKAIEFMASKGFIEGRTETAFEPDAAITRAEFTAFLVKTFYVLDRTLKTTFMDVPDTDPAYPFIASSQKENIVEGYPDNIFKGSDIINREQIVSICARALVEKKKYTYPEDAGAFLTYSDSSMISDWAQKEVALALREKLIDMSSDGIFGSQAPMTRGEAAVLVYRLFQLLYEVTPTELGALDESEGIVSEGASESDGVSPVLIMGAAGAAAVVAGGFMWLRRRKNDSTQE